MITGGCLCGAVRYEATSAPLVSRICWCKLCQKLGAGSGTVNVVFRADDVQINGQLTTYRCTADSGNAMTRGFCPICGTPVMSQSDVRKHQIIMRAGTLDDPEVAKPDLTIWTAEAPSWACISANYPTIPGQPGSTK
jgi:hypothetical protein